MGFMFSKPTPSPVTKPPLMETAWCEINWSQNKDNMRKIHARNQAVKPLRILVVGPVGAGKSSFIQSIVNIFQNRIINAACSVASNSGKGFTTDYKLNLIQDKSEQCPPFFIADAMGLEVGEDTGVQTKDIVNVLKGHIKDGYTFNPVKPCPREDSKYNANPTLDDKIHCLVFVIPIDNFRPNYTHETNAFSENSLFNKMQKIKRKARDLKIPQLIILTKVDLACNHVREDIKHIYRSHALYEKVKACSNDFGLPESCIFLVKNYHEEKQLKPDMDAVLLFTLSYILEAASDFVESKSA